MAPSFVASDSLVGTSGALRQYARAFTGSSSILVVAPARVAAAAAEPAFAGWTVTDCSEQFIDVAGGGHADQSDQLVFESSGTTGDPKLVRYRKQVLRSCALAIGERLGLAADREYVSLVNPRFAFGLSIVHSHLLAEATVRIAAPPVALDAWTRFRKSLRPDMRVYLAPHQSFLLAQDPTWRFDAPIELLFAGSPLRRSMIDALQRCFPLATITNMYGQSELGPRIATSSTPIGDFREGDVGRPLPGVRVRSGPAGELEVDSPFRMVGYVTVTGADSDSGSSEWWPTGDVGTVDADGRVVVTGRAAPDINFLGARIRTEHLREAVRAVEGVLDASVSTVTHRALGQCPRIRVLVPAPADADVTERAVRIALSDTIGNAAAAVVVDIVDAVSLPESGKL